MNRRDRSPTQLSDEVAGSAMRPEAADDWKVANDMERSTHDPLQQDQQGMQETAQQKAEEVREMASDKMNQVADRADQQRERAAGGMQQAADQIRQRADQIPGGERGQQFAHTAADKMESAAGYMRSTDVSGMARDLEAVVRDHPKESLIAAAAIGFFVGRALRS